MKKIKKIILCILSLFLVLCLYQWYIQSKDTYRFKSVTYTQKTLPKEFNGFTIGYLSDLNLSTKEDLNHLKEAVKDCRDGESKSIIMHSTRVGLSDKQSDDFKNLQLRTIIGPLLSSYAYKEKEKVFRNYIVSDNISKEEAEKISIDILGYCPKSLIESVYQA